MQRPAAEQPRNRHRRRQHAWPAGERREARGLRTRLGCRHGRREHGGGEQPQQDRAHPLHGTEEEGERDGGHRLVGPVEGQFDQRVEEGVETRGKEIMAETTLAPRMREVVVVVHQVDIVVLAESDGDEAEQGRYEEHPARHRHAGGPFG
jgi:hypothetical protein